VEGVSIRQAVPLVDKPSGEVEEIPSLQNHLQDGLPDLRLAEVNWRRRNTKPSVRNETEAEGTGK
jgi:hypothetical protein